MARRLDFVVPIRLSMLVVRRVIALQVMLIPFDILARDGGPNSGLPNNKYLKIRLCCLKLLLYCIFSKYKLKGYYE